MFDFLKNRKKLSKQDDKKKQRRSSATRRPPPKAANSLSGFSIQSNSSPASVVSDVEDLGDPLDFEAASAGGRWEIHQSVTECIGETPIIQLQRMSPKQGVDIYVKCEQMNPGASLKDRLALGIIEYAEATGQIKPGQTVIDASSGNTGIGLAMVCAAKG